MIMPSHLNGLVALTLLVLVSSGCSSDSDDNDQSTLSGVPRPITDDGTSAESSDTDTPTSGETTPADDTPATEPTPSPTDTPADAIPASEPTTPGTPETPTDEPATPTTPELPETTATPADADVNNLIGNVLFQFSFNESSDVFTLEKRFPAESSGVDPLSGAPFVQIGEGSNIVTRCGLVPDELPYFCVEATAESGTDVSLRLFRFNLDSTRNGTGAFEFCPTGTPVTTCTTDAFSTPDGTVTVSVDAANAIANVRLTVSQQHITTDLKAHHLVAEQAQITSEGDDIRTSVSGTSIASSVEQRAVSLLMPALAGLGMQSADR